jgi:TetR/AcrR family tetracycline transcriptional repressor
VTKTTKAKKTGVKDGKRASRTPWGTITRERIIELATSEVRAGRYETMSIRRLAADLGVAPMSLYRHVRDKEDILDELVDRLLDESWQPIVSIADWRGWVIDAADRLRQLLVSQPAALQVFLAHPVVSPAAVERMNLMLNLLRDATANEVAARRAYSSVHTFTLGFAALEAARTGWIPRDDTPALALELGGLTTPQHFRDSIRAILDGVIPDTV